MIKKSNNSLSKHPADYDMMVAASQSMLYRYCLSLCGNVHDADDIVQNTFIEAHRSFHTFNKDLDFGSWIRGIARNMAKRHWRKASQKSRLTVSLDPAVIEELEKFHLHEEMTDCSPLDALKYCMQKLELENQEFIWARYRDKIKLKMLAQSADKTLSWAKSKITRLRIQLAECVTNRLCATEIVPESKI